MIIFNQNEWPKKMVWSRRDAFHPVVSDYARRRIQLIAKCLTSSSFDSCLELGAGDGFFSVQLMNYFRSFVATDSSAEMLKKNPCSGSKIISNAEKLEFSDNSFDVVFEANMLHHTGDDRKAAEEMVRVSKDYVIVIEPNRLHPLTIILGLIKSHERKSLLFSKKYIKDLFSGLNVDLDYSVSFGVVPANKCPVFIWKILKYLDVVIPVLGLENILIFRKNNGSN